MAVLVVNDLKKSYVAPDGTRLPIIDIPRLELKEGEQLALQGSSGGGKTTLLHLIAGILKPDSGSIMINGADIGALGEADRDRVRTENIGYVFQTFNLLQGYSALENVLLGMLFGPGADEARAKKLIDRVGLSGRSGYRPRQLSVGQQQRVAVARALANNPRLVLADEPTGNLDAKNAREALTLIRDVCRENNAALLLVSHDREVLSQFDNIKDLKELNRAAAAVA